MNRTQAITQDGLLQSGLEGDRLLLEGLLRRGFLAYRDEQGVWLGTGSHAEDVDVLKLIPGLKVKPVFGHKKRMASLQLQSPRVGAMDVAIRIIALPENSGLITGGGIPGYFSSWDRIGRGWSGYRKMAWGAKLPACPMQEKGQSKVNNALDIGVALLVKALPLARVATGLCCDGHGERPASVSLCLEWDMRWGRAVFEVLAGATPESTWTWEYELVIAPRGGFDDAAVSGLLNDIQDFARRLLDQSTIDKIGRARARTLEVFGEIPPAGEKFSQEAQCQLAEKFA